MTAAPAARRVGVMGGAFDPPHLAHRALLEAAQLQLQLDELRVIPTGQAWHKPRALSDASHRLAMVQLAFGDLPGATLDPREITRDGPSYTVDTLRELRAERPTDQFFLIIGADQARALTSWRAWSEILQLAIICVADRACAVGESDRCEAEQAAPSRFLHLAMPALDISATDIRNRISARQSVSTLVCEAVARYIADHHLYQTV